MCVRVRACACVCVCVCVGGWQDYSATIKAYGASAACSLSEGQALCITKSVEDLPCMDGGRVGGKARDESDERSA